MMNILDYAMRLYMEGRISKSRAAELAQVSLHDILDEIERRGLRAPYTPNEIQEDLALLRARYDASAPTRRRVSVPPARPRKTSKR